MLPHFEEIERVDTRKDESKSSGRVASDSGENPYQVTSTEPIPFQTGVFSRRFWLASWGALLASLLFFSFSLFTFHWTSTIGLFCLLTSIFALGRSFATTMRARAYMLNKVTLRLPESEFVFLVASFLLGGIATIASCVAFFAICIPVGSVLFDFQPVTGGSNADQIIIPLSIVCGMIGFLLGCFFIYLTLPSLRRDRGAPTRID